VATERKSSGEAEIALKRVHDTEPETVPHNRHVQGHAPIQRRCKIPAWAEKVEGFFNSNAKTPGAVPPVFRKTTTSARNRAPTTTTSGFSRETESKKSTFNSASGKSGFGRRENYACGDAKNGSGF
jgi:hypothetical protein